MNTRTLTGQILEALTDPPVVFLRWARQTGKTTLVKQLAEEISLPGNLSAEKPWQYISLDSSISILPVRIEI